MSAPDAAHRAELARHFDGVQAGLQRDITAMRDSIDPARFDQDALDRAQAAFGRAEAELVGGFAELERAALTQP